MNPAIIPLAMGKKLARLSSLTLVWQLITEKKNSEFKFVKLHVKLTSCWILVMVEGWVNTYLLKKSKFFISFDMKLSEEKF